MIQDLAPLGARLYFTGHIYFADSRRCANPQFFAPYLAEKCVKSLLTPEVTAAGISSYSEVVEILRPTFEELFRFPDGYQPPSQVAGHPSWPLWCTGILGWQLSAERAIKDGKDWSKWPPQHVYLLDKPVPLGHTIEKCGELPQVPPGFGTSFDRLKHGKCIGELRP